MRTRWMKPAGLLLLCVYAAAIAHQLLPHDSSHGSGDSCSLCLLLTSVVLLALCVTLGLEHAVRALFVAAHAVVFSRQVRQPFSLRGPPSVSL